MGGLKSVVFAGFILYVFEIISLFPHSLNVASSQQVGPSLFHLSLEPSVATSPSRTS